MENNTYFIKISYERKNESTDLKHCDAKINYSNKLNKERVKSNKYLIGGGIYNKNSGCFIFKAKDSQEAKQIANNNSFIKHKGYEYKRLSVTMFT
ncbi:hypothetical protein ACFIJ5_00945 [Haloimpatiens sp. FM7330]|uniref:hypothetical protein n=1 Tax=Haloimpatiens sp. FM7330 TaxID=3298610 RepID=UPI00364367D2